MIYRQVLGTHFEANSQRRVNCWTSQKSFCLAKMMSLEQIASEYETRGRLSTKAVSALRAMVTSDDPYSAITLVGDCRVHELASRLVELLQHGDPMVRWNATSVLFSRLKMSEYASECLRVSEEDDDSIVKCAALAGLGEIAPTVGKPEVRAQIGHRLLEVLESDGELVEVRGAAYEGILAAIEVPPLQRPPANKLTDMDTDVDGDAVEIFRKRYAGAS